MLSRFMRSPWGSLHRSHAPGSVCAGHAGGDSTDLRKNVCKTGMAYAIISKVAVIYA